MSDIDEEEEHDAKIRESFQLLTQGVEMVHYQVARPGVPKSCKSKKIVWLVGYCIKNVCYYLTFSLGSGSLAHMC
jgi:hypothetical protein